MQEPKHLRRGRNDYAAVCQGKEAFETYRLAEKVKKSMCRRTTGGLDVYHCPHCRKFHIGRNKFKGKYYGCK